MMYFTLSKYLFSSANSYCTIRIHLRGISLTTSDWSRFSGGKNTTDVRWRFLEHNGPYFPPPYVPLPAHVKFFYEDKELKLSTNAEEVATLYAKSIQLDSPHSDKFNNNFFEDWRDQMTDKERELIRDLKKCDFTNIHEYFTEENEKKKSLSKEEKEKLKKLKEEVAEKYGFCTIDGRKEKIANYVIEPPGLFRGRGDHPKLGRLKKRTEPENVIVNCSYDSKHPSPPEGHRWKDVLHDNKVEWLACWKSPICDKIKYIRLSQTSKLYGEKDHQKYELARKLAKRMKKIRKIYHSDLKSDNVKIRQRAVALYFIDKLALRAGNEKDDDEVDTVGCCSLRIENIQLHEEKNGQKYVVVFNFLGKDSIRYFNEVSVDKRVFSNLKLFCRGKKNSDQLFDKLSPNFLNKYLNELMPGLTTKVFRTFNASITLQNQLEILTDEQATVSEKLQQYNRANIAVAVLCNHQRTVAKTYEKYIDNLNSQISKKKEQIKNIRNELKKLEEERTNTKQKEKLLERKKKQIQKLKEQFEKLNLRKTDKEETKTVALATSKVNYLDPRISVSWCKKHNVPLEKIYNKTQQSKFEWAIDSTSSDFKF